MSHDSIDQALQTALAHHQAGRLADAEAAYRKILAAQPANADTLHLLGVLLGQGGDFPQAAQLIRQAIALNAANPDYFCNLGYFLQKLGKLDASIACYRRALALNPANPQIHNSLGTVLRHAGQPDAAIESFQRAVSLAPGFAQTHYNLAVALEAIGRFDEASAAYQHALTLDPANAQAHNNLGNVWIRKGLPDLATACFQQALALNPDYPEAHNNLGSLHLARNDYENAAACYQRAVSLNPDFANAHYNLATALQLQGRFGDAIAHYRRALALQPDDPRALNSLGAALQKLGQLDDAFYLYQQALALTPDYAEAHYNLAAALADTGQMSAAIASYRRAQTCDPANLLTHAALLQALNYDPAIHPRDVLAEAREWNRRRAHPHMHDLQPHANDRDRGRPLRIGYISPDLRNHPVGRFMLPLLAAHDREQFEIFCYSDVNMPDSLTAKLQSHAPAWRSIAKLPDAQAASLIRQDRIDILVDLAGHTAGNRLLLFAKRPAPVQATYLGYPATTGLATMDYRLTDALADPPGQTDAYCTEKLLRLPRTAWCFIPPEDAPPVGELPALAAGHVTFGSFNDLAKLNDAVLKDWAGILHAVPAARLLIRARGISAASVRRRLLGTMSDLGIRSDRLELRDWVADPLAGYHAIDIALDSFPYHGTTTTCEALWMGVPVITLAGEAHVSRVGVSLLTNIGLPELVAGDREHYQQIAADLAGDLPRLTHLRATLRQRMTSSPLMDAPRFARGIEGAYQAMWQAWCEGGNP